jgi:hypothetical protein
VCSFLLGLMLEGLCVTHVTLCVPLSFSLVIPLRVNLENRELS